jgi:hypothetical protein
MHGGEYGDAIAALIPGRTKKQCGNRWEDVLDPSIDQVTLRTGKWAEDEDMKQKDAVQAHVGKNGGGGICRAGSGANKHSVLESMASYLGYQHRPSDWTYG